MWLIVVSLSLAALLFYLNVSKRFSYWKNKGIPYSKPIYFLGNFASNVFRIKSFETIVEECYKEFPKSRYSGMYQFRIPVLLIRDPELVKQVTIKDFDVFPEHTRVIPLDAEPLFSKNLFNMLHDEGWHDMRATLSPTFTASKMRAVFTLMRQCSDQFVNYYKQSKGNVSVDLKDAFTRFANDVIGTSAFGVTCDSLTHKNNEFYVMGKALTNFSGLRSLRFFSYTISPFFSKLLRIRILNTKLEEFFKSLIRETLAIRTQKNIIRADMIQLLMEAQRNREQDGQQRHKKNSISDDDITAQALIFFLAGFEVTSTAMTFLAYELALNPEIQTKLYEEISTTLEENSGKITYEAVMSMKYLDRVVSESLRLHAPVPFIDRKSVKPYTIQPDDPSEEPLHLEKGTTVWVPVSSIHHDEQYFPNPMKFDPERFNDDNKHNIKPFTYLPFGSGPRICIGSRFALLEIKLIILQILQHFEIVRDAKTAVPLKPDKTNFNNLPKEGVWVSLKPRILN
uniref:Cytochrome P450 n=1 Tax=Photinus pyralis TaxID=7054 RepID=A0A1Y1L0G7_PHOPY